MNDERIAVLDVGSNSVRLLVTEKVHGRAVCIHGEKITTRLIAGMENHILTKEAIDRTAEAIRILAERARGMGAREICAFGTSALRDGENRDALIRQVEKDVSLRVLSGEEEADLAYAGAAPEGHAGVIDIGGGSTELMAGHHGQCMKAISVNMGAVRLHDMMKGNLNPKGMLEKAQEILQDGWNRFPFGRVERWVGVGGTLTSLAAMSLSLTRYSPDAVQHYVLGREKTLDWYCRLCETSLEERKRLPGLNPERADIIPFGTAIAAAFFEISGAKSLEVSDRDNLMGFAEKIFADRG